MKRGVIFDDIHGNAHIYDVVPSKSFCWCVVILTKGFMVNNNARWFKTKTEAAKFGEVMHKGRREYIIGRMFV